MTKWTKVEKKRSGRRREGFALLRQSGYERKAFVVVPGHEAVSDKLDVFSDGNGKIALHLHDDGGRSLYKANPSAGAVRATLPAEIAHLIPFGTHDVEVTRDGDMIVIDTAQLQHAAE